jgi:hypothetical protein
MNTMITSDTKSAAGIQTERIAKELVFNYMLGWIERSAETKAELLNREKIIRKASKRAESCFEIFMGVASNLLNRPEGENTHWKTARFQPKETCP